MPLSLKKWFPYFLLAGILLNAIGLFTDILEPDSALYASISKHIAVTNDWVNLIGSGHDWLDKPHLPFWLCAVSFKCFGITPFAYKLPAFLCFLTGVFYTYKLAKAMYDESTAKLSVIIYITALHIVLSNFDIRAEAFLTAFILAAIYHIYKAAGRKWLMHIFAAAVFCALAVMTKGIFVLITIASGFIVYWVFSKQYRQLIRPKWILLIALTALFIIPELYCLYLQFDLHPEKIIFGHTNVSGIHFFFWDSQFGRFFNNGPIKGNGDIFFFVHTFLWAFLPWSLITLGAFVSCFKRMKNQHNLEPLILFGSFLVSFIMFSVSKFQLPHYIVIVFPQIAIITSNYLLSLRSEQIISRINHLQFIIFLMSAAFILLLTYISGFATWYIPLMLIVILMLSIILVFKQKGLTSIVGKCVCFSLLVSLFFNMSFYPPLMKYQAGMLAVKWLNEHPQIKKIVIYHCSSQTFEFYSNAAVLWVSNMDTIPTPLNMNDTVNVFTPLKEIEKLRQQGKNVIIMQEFNYFHITKLTWKFLNNETREHELDKYVLAEYSTKQ